MVKTAKVVPQIKKKKIITVIKFTGLLNSACVITQV
jgi:hypothetical protein